MIGTYITDDSIISSLQSHFVYSTLVFRRTSAQTTVSANWVLVLMTVRWTSTLLKQSWREMTCREVFGLRWKKKTTEYDLEESAARKAPTCLNKIVFRSRKHRALQRAVPSRVMHRVSMSRSTNPLFPFQW